MGKLIDLTGHRFGRLVVIKRVENKGKQTSYLCACDCGKEKIFQGGNLKSGNTKSCGCLKKEIISQAKTTHDLRKNPLYVVWNCMKQRCYNKNSERYNDWGGRGIRVCDEWYNDFKTFYDWSIENGYEKGLHIDRIDNDGNYEPSNCRWVTPRESSSHTRKSSTYGTGVYKMPSGKFQAKVAIFGKKQYLGTFESDKKAKEYRDMIVRRYEIIVKPLLEAGYEHPVKVE